MSDLVRRLVIENRFNLIKGFHGIQVFEVSHDKYCSQIDPE